MVSSVLAGSVSSILRLVRRVSSPIDHQVSSICGIGSHINTTGGAVSGQADCCFNAWEMPVVITGVLYTWGPSLYGRLAGVAVEHLLRIRMKHRPSM